MKLMQVLMQLFTFVLYYWMSSTQNYLMEVVVWVQSHLYGWGVDVKLLENGKGFLKELVADGDVSDVWGIIVVQPVDVLHHTSAVSLDGRQNEQVLEVPEGKYPQQREFF